MSEVKKASTSAPDITAHRQLSAQEEAALAAGKSRWMPRIFQSYGTPIPELMASPLKTGLIFGAPIGIIGAGLGSALGGKHNSGMGALVGGLGAGGLAALAAGMDRAAKNEGLEELMRRMPEGAAKRDLEADPQYQADFLGWDNNKIVATARARYYRPTERFSKRTDDMADARARYNERHKTSSSHSVNNKDVSMSQSEKQAMSPAAQAILNQLLTSGVLGSVIGGAGGAISSKHKLRGAARGAIMGAGTGMGVGAGLPLGGGLASGAMVNLSGPPRSLQDLSNLGNAAIAGSGAGGTLGGIAGYSGSKALADALVPMGKEDEEESKKAAYALLNNTTLTLSEKMAAYKALLEKRAEPATMAGQLPAATGPAMSAPDGFNPKNMQAPMSATTGRVMNDPDVEALLSSAAPSRKWTPPGTIPAVSQNFNVDSTRIDDNKLTQFLNKQLAAAHRGVVGAANGVGSAGSRVMTAFGDLAKYLKPEQKKAPDPTLFDQLKPYAPYAAVGGAGLGALALADYLSRRNKTKPKKSKREDEEYSMPKAANINWYKVAREVHRQKRAMIPTPYALPMAPAAIRAMTSPGLLSRLASMGRSALPYIDPLSKKSLPFWAGMTLGDVTGSTGGFGGRAAVRSMFQGQDPSFLEQVMKSKYTPYAAAGLGTAGLLGGAAYMGSRAGKKEVAKKKKPEGEKQSDFNLSNIGMGAGAGAGLGGVAGGLYGALAPGYEEDPMTGRRRRRSRLMAALRGLAGGAAAGGLAGGAAGHFLGPQLERYFAMQNAQQNARATAVPQPEVTNALGGDVNLNNQGAVSFKKRPNMGATNTAPSPIPASAQPDDGTDLAAPMAAYPNANNREALLGAGAEPMVVPNEVGGGLTNNPAMQTAMR